MLLNASGKVTKKTILAKDLVEPLRKKQPAKTKADDAKYLQSVFAKRLGGE